MAAIRREIDALDDIPTSPQSTYVPKESTTAIEYEQAVPEIDRQDRSTRYRADAPWTRRQSELHVRGGRRLAGAPRQEENGACPGQQ